MTPAPWASRHGGAASAGSRRTGREHAGHLARVEGGRVERGLVAVGRAPEVRVLVVHAKAQVVGRLQEVLRRHARRRLRRARAQSSQPISRCAATLADDCAADGRRALSQLLVRRHARCRLRSGRAQGFQPSPKFCQQMLSRGAAERRALQCALHVSPAPRSLPKEPFGRRGTCHSMQGGS